MEIRLVSEFILLVHPLCGDRPGRKLQSDWSVQMALSPSYPEKDPAVQGLFPFIPIREVECVRRATLYHVN
jgi:hypothetical protein